MTAAGAQPTAADGDAADERLRLLARALIETALQVREDALAVGVRSANGAEFAELPSLLDSEGASRYPPTPRGCGPAQRRRRRSRSDWSEADHE